MRLWGTIPSLSSTANNSDPPKAAAGWNRREAPGCRSSRSLHQCAHPWASDWVVRKTINGVREESERLKHVFFFNKSESFVIRMQPNHCREHETSTPTLTMDTRTPLGRPDSQTRGAKSWCKQTFRSVQSQNRNLRQLKALENGRSVSWERIVQEKSTRPNKVPSESARGLYMCRTANLNGSCKTLYFLFFSGITVVLRTPNSRFFFTPPQSVPLLHPWSRPCLALEYQLSLGHGQFGLQVGNFHKNGPDGEGWWSLLVLKSILLEVKPNLNLQAASGRSLKTSENCQVSPQLIFF